MPGYLRFRYFSAGPVGVIPADLEGEDLEQVLAAFLKADAAIASIVGPRVYPIAPPQTAELPNLVYQMISGSGDRDLQGYVGISRARIRITARSRLFGECALLREAVRQLDDYRGLMGPVRVIDVEFSDVKDDYIEPPRNSSDRGTYERKFDLHFRYREQKPVN
jgi:hypothetical protein